MGHRYLRAANASAIGALFALSFGFPSSHAQNPQLQERVTEIKQAAASNKQLLAHYTWQERQTISIKGEVKKQKLYSVEPGPNGKPQKTEIDPQDQTSEGGRRHGLKHHIVEKKTEEYEEYAKQIAALAQDYAQPDPERLQELYQQGSITLGSAGTPGEFQLIIHNYVKQGDSMSLVFNRAQKALQSIHVSSYLADPKDAVTLSAQFAQDPGGPDHVSSMLINGESKQLTVATQNYNYQKL
jgi:hypothetical protein